MPEKCVLRKKKECLCTHCSKTVSAGVCGFTSDQSREQMLKRSISRDVTILNYGETENNTPWYSVVATHRVYPLKFNNFSMTFP